jgi:hypothetical protein
MKFNTLNKQVACTPLANQAVTMKVLNGFASAEQRNSLEELTVVFMALDESDGTAYFKSGTKIFVKGEDFNALWAKKVYKLGDKEFILVPMSSIALVGTEEE